VKEEAPQYLKTIRAILSSNEIINPTPNQVAGFIGGVNSHKTDPNCEPGEHWMEEEDRYSMSSRGRGIESAATDEGEARGVHVKRNGVGAGVEKTMSMSARGMESAATDEGEARGVHVKRKGVGAGVEKSMSMAERGEKSTGVPRSGKNESKISVLYHKDKIYYSRTDPPMLKKMVELQVFNTEKSAKNSIPRLREYAEEEGKFELKPGARGKPRKDFVPYRGACGSGMPSDLKVWLSVGEIPKDGNVTELKLQPKRKRAAASTKRTASTNKSASTKRTASTKKAASDDYSREDECSEEDSSEDEGSEKDDN
jgi:hypothetical protein